jgi:L-lactate utilization protein LutB
MSDTKGTITIVVVLSGVTEDEAKQAVGCVRSAACVAASAIGCEAGGAHAYLARVYDDPRRVVEAHASAMRHVQEKQAAHERGECDCDDDEVISRVVVNTRTRGDA